MIFGETSLNLLAEERVCGLHIREFKIYDATEAKTSLKIASSSFSIYFAIMSVCLTFESKASGTTQELNLEVRCQRYKIKFKFAPECSRSL